MTQIVGVLHLASKYKYGLTNRGAPLYLFRPYDEALPDYIVGSSERDTSRNQIALVTVTTTATPASALEKPRGALVKLFGQVGDPDAEKQALLQHYCPISQKKTSDAIAEILEHPTDSQRIEFPPEEGWRTWHVDPPGCRDIDDAISWNALTGAWAVTIADVAALVPEGSTADKNAAAIGSTFYDLDGRVEIPMLDRQLSEGLGSLLPGKRRRGISYIWGPMEEERIALSWVTVAYSYTYESFGESPFATLIGITDAHDWIAEKMIQYNRMVAALLKENSIGTLRVQKESDAPWATLPGLAHLGAEAATYEAAGPEVDGHASLCLRAYTHASSPLRRYADLLNQRALHAILQGRSHEALTLATVSHLNVRAKANKRWARDLTFLRHVTPGKVHTIDIIWMEEGRVYVPAWGRIICLRHTPTNPGPPCTEGRIQIFCDPTKPNWKRRIQTADVNEQQQ